MKTFLLTSTATLLAIFSFSAFADRIVITGEPIVIEKNADVYVPASTITSDSDYYYFTVNNTKRVCYRDVNPALVNVDAGIFAVKIGDQVVDLHCYNYDTTYFTVQ